MFYEICFIIITLSIVILTTVVTTAVFKSADAVTDAKKTMKKAGEDIQEISEEGIKLLRNIDDLTEDLREKSESLDFIFKPLHALNEECSTEIEKVKKNDYEDVAQVLELVTSGIVLFNKIKGGFRNHGKFR